MTFGCMAYTNESDHMIYKLYAKGKKSMLDIIKIPKHIN